MASFMDKENIARSKSHEGCESEDVSKDFKHVFERVKLYEANVKGTTLPSNQKPHTKCNNLLFLVPTVILFILFALYLTTTGFQWNHVSQKSFGQEVKNVNEQPLDSVKRKQILERLLEYKDLCTELEIFTKDLRWENKFIDEEDHRNEFGEFDVKDDSEAMNSIMSSVNEEELIDTKTSGSLPQRILQRRKNKAALLKNKKVKPENNKNYSNSNNNNKNNELTVKKANTAEPIIYLFALVFIYLLLKAASDINQHYKSQKKGDKRLRRCSLQSYAQTHKQDRRASKGLHRICTRTY